MLPQYTFPDFETFQPKFAKPGPVAAPVAAKVEEEVEDPFEIGVA